MTTLIRQNAMTRQNAISIDDLLFVGACESVNAQIMCHDDDDVEDTASSKPSIPDAPRKGLATVAQILKEMLICIMFPKGCDIVVR